MTLCQRCNSKRVAGAQAKCSDLFYLELGTKQDCCYPPSDIGIGKGGDYVSLKWCLDCGQIQDTFPKPLSEFETSEVD